MTAITGIHPHAECYPMLSDDELAVLEEDISENGLRDPITIDSEGLLLDGRNRYRVCQKLGIEPDVVVFDGDDVGAFVRSRNVRRHQSTGSRAMSTALSLQMDGRRENGRWVRETINQNSDLSRGFHVALTNAGVVLDFKPDLADDVIAGVIALNDAYEQAKAIKDSEERDKILERERRKREKEEAAEEAERNAQIIADLEQAESKYLPMIHDGTMKPASAWAAHRADNKKELDRQAAERRNDEQQARMVCSALAKLEFLDYDTQREWCITSISAYPNAVPDRDRSFHTPERIRHYAGMLSTYADEVEAADAA